MRILMVIAGLLLTAAMTSCTTDYSQVALASAREYTLEHTKSLPESVRNFIRYTIPKVYGTTVFAATSMSLTDYAHIDRTFDFKAPRNPNRDYMMINFAWFPPDVPYSVIALGAGERGYRFWEPYRVILKKFALERPIFDGIQSKGQNYIMNSMTYLSAKEKNRVRFSDGRFYETCFPLDFLSEFKKDPKGGPDDWKNYISNLKTLSDQKQYSLIWRLDDPDKIVAAVGFSSKENMSDWTPAAGLSITRNKFKQYAAGTEIIFPNKELPAQKDKK